MAAQRPTNGVALTHDIPIVDSNGDLVTGITFQAADYVCYQDGVVMSPSTLDNTPTELGSTGIYAFTFSAAEMTCDRLTVAVADDAGGAFEPFTIVINPQDALITDADINSEVDTAISDAALATAAALATVDTNVDAILVDTGTTLPGTLTTIDGKIDTVDTNVDAILVDTGTTLDDKLNDMQVDVDSILTDTSTTIPALFPASFNTLNIGNGAAEADLTYVHGDALGGTKPHDTP